MIKKFCLNALLVLLFVLLAAPLASAQQNPADELIQKLISTPTEQLDSVLLQNKASLTDDLLRRIVELAFNSIDNGKPDDASNYTDLADYIDYFLLDKKEYRGIATFLTGSYFLEKTPPDSDKALNMADKILKVVPNNFRGHLLKGKAYIAKHDYDKALTETQESVKNNPDSEDAHLTLAYIYVVQNNIAPAISEFQEVLKINPQNPKAKDAIAALSKNDDPYKSYKKEAVAHFYKAEDFFNKGMYAEAITEYQKAIAIEPKFTKAYIYEGDSYLALGNRDEAIKYYKKAIQIDPKDRQAHRFLGDVYEKIFDETGNMKYLDLAITCYENAVKADPAYNIAASDLERARKKKEQKLKNQ